MLIFGSIMAMIALIDSAFSFFQNYPCRLTHVEMDCDLPCEEIVFNSVHPFSKPNFRFSRNITVSEALRGLFEECPEDPPNSPVTSVPQNDTSNLGFTVFDMFLLIHRMHTLSYTYSQLLTRPSAIRLHQHPHDPSDPYPPKIPDRKVTEHNPRRLYPSRNPYSPIAMARPLGEITQPITRGSMGVYGLLQEWI